MATYRRDEIDGGEPHHEHPQPLEHHQPHHQDQGHQEHHHHLQHQHHQPRQQQVRVKLPKTPIQQRLFKWFEERA